MIGDILTVMWKERKDLFRYQGSVRSLLLTLISPVAMFGLVFPLQTGRDWLTDAFLSLMVSVITPLLLLGIKIPDSIAGERERHTLPTLLASRLPDHAILLGKIASAIAFAWGVTLLTHLTALLVVNIRYWEGHLLFYPAKIALVNLGVSILFSFFVAALGLQISYRAESVQKAAQTLMFGLLAIPMVLQVVFMLALSAGPTGRALIDRFLGAVTSTPFVIGAAVLLLLVDVLLGVVAVKRFRRSRLILI